MADGGQRGMTGSVQMALLFPLALLVLLATLQWSLLLWAEAVALAAAQDAARTAGVFGGSSDDGRREGQRAASGGALADVQVAVTREPRWTTATVEGRAVQLIPLVNATVRQTAQVPTERVR
ncbi:MAG: TadE/TadG family type IV pilus assembly protein [Propionibacteriaceae bacterium]|nr:TadE/TadG family type IV pilus assembly protein [Propionibacteriaceae bacterium]